MNEQISAASSSRPLPFQDLGHVLERDAANLGIEVEDRRQRSERLLAKAGNEELRKVRRRARDGVAVATVQDAQALREKVGGKASEEGRAREGEREGGYIIG